MTDLYLYWDETYSVTKFPPAKKFFGEIDEAKNCHILHHQIPHVPKIHRLILAIEDEVSNIIVDSVWLIKKTITDDGFQEWHQDFKHMITKTIVVNVGVVEPLIFVCAIGTHWQYKICIRCVCSRSTKLPPQSCSNDPNSR